MKIYILAGGEGTRMQPWTQLVPKCLLPVGGIPVSRIIIDRLLDKGFNDIVLCINKPFEKEFRHEFRDIEDIKFSITEAPVGTAGEVYNALKNYPSDASGFGVIYSDDLTEIDYKLMMAEHYESEKPATIAVTANLPLDIGIVNIEDNEIIDFKEKPLISDLKPDTYVWTGVAFFKPDIKTFFAPQKDIAKNIFKEMLTEGLKIGFFMSYNPWWDIGQLQHYKKVKEIFEKEKEKEISYKPPFTYPDE